MRRRRTGCGGGGGLWRRRGAQRLPEAAPAGRGSRSGGTAAAGRRGPVLGRGRGDDAEHDADHCRSHVRRGAGGVRPRCEADQWVAQGRERVPLGDARSLRAGRGPRRRARQRRRDRRRPGRGTAACRGRRARVRAALRRRRPRSRPQGRRRARARRRALPCRLRRPRTPRASPPTSPGCWAAGARSSTRKGSSSTTPSPRLTVDGRLAATISYGRGSALVALSVHYDFKSSPGLRVPAPRTEGSVSELEDLAG